MLSAACVGTNDLEKAGRFYDRVLVTIGMKRGFANEVEIAYSSSDDKLTFWVLKPYNGESASVGNGSQLMFVALNQKAVNSFYHAALSNGGSDEGAPGPRDYREGYYGAYCRDLDGNKLHVFCIES